MKINHYFLIAYQNDMNLGEGLLGGIWGKFEGENRGRYGHLSLYTSLTFSKI